MKTLTLHLKPVGKNGFVQLRRKLDRFVEDSFEILYEGGVRMGCNIPADYYAPRRVQIRETRLHAHQGLKYATGHKYSDDAAPSEAQLRHTVKDIQSLIDAAAENVPAPFTLTIVSEG